jgi:hypothetical protein
LVPGQAILADDPPTDAAIVTTVEEKLALDYLTTIWGQRPDVRAISTAQIVQILNEERPLLVTRTAASYAAAESGLDLCYIAWGPTLLLAAPGQLPPLPPISLVSTARPLGDGLELVGLKISAGEEASVWKVWLALRAQMAPQSDWSLSARLFTDEGELAQQDHSAPALGYTPTTTLHPGDTVSDAFRFTIPADRWPQGLRLILYRQRDDGSFQNLTIIEEALPSPP